MKTRTVFLGVLWLGGLTSAGEPAKEAKPSKITSIEADSKALGLSVPDLTRLRQLGFADPEIAYQTAELKRTPRQMITEREVINDMSKAYTDMEERVHKLPYDQRAAERESTIKATLTRVRRDHRTSRDDLRKILANTNFLTADETKRYLGPGLFSVDTLERVTFRPEQDKR